MELIACVGSDKENWGQITALMHRLECEKIILVMYDGVSDFPINEKCLTVRMKIAQPIALLKQELLEKLRPLLSSDFEVAVSLASGSGKEHMALLGALLNIPVGVKLVVYTKDGIQFIT